MKIPASFKTVSDALILLLWGVFILWIAAVGKLPIYLHPSLQRFTEISGFILLILTCFLFHRIFSELKAGHHCCENHQENPKEKEHHDHASVYEKESHAGHSHGEESVCLSSFLFKSVMLLIPLVFVLFGQGTHFTMTTVENRGVVDTLGKLPAAKASQGEGTLTHDSATASSVAMPIQIIDLLYAVQMPSYREEFEGKEVELTGQYIPLTTGNPKGDRFQAVRMFITCCAADAKPVGVTIQYPNPPKVSEMGWLKITGKPTFPMEGGRRTAVLVASKVEECSAPNEPFVY